MSTIYVKLDMKHPDYDVALALCRLAFSAEFPDNQLSVNTKADGTVCWVETTTDHGVTGDVLLDTATHADHADKVLADVYSPGWAQQGEA